MRSRNILVAMTALVLLSGCVNAPEAPTEDGFSFVTIGDSRGDEPIVQPQAYLDCIKQINSLPSRPAFVINVGDLILGSEDEQELIMEEWDEFDRVTQEIKVPVHLVPGNHDVWDEQSYAIFTDRYGPTYYSFDHGNSHFVVLSSEEQEEGEASKITGAQLKWLAADLDKHKAAVHTFVFLHKPFWTGLRGLDKTSWDEDVHPLLAKHNVDIVFAGHDHEYVNYGTRDGVQYYVTGGGGAPLHAMRETGGFHHFMVTTVDGSQVGSVVVESDGQVQADTVVMHETVAAYNLLSRNLRFPGVRLPEKENTIEVANTVENPLDGEIKIDFHWATEDTAWQMKPVSGSLLIPRGEKAILQVTATFDRDRLIPLPVMNAEVILDGKRITTIKEKIQPLIPRQTTVARVNTPPEIDGSIGQDEYGAATATSGFVDYRGLGYPTQDTSFMLAYDNNALYIAIVAQEQDTDNVTIKPRGRDGKIWMDDYIDMFIDATFDRTTYHQLAVSLGEAQYDGIGGPGHGQYGDAKWDAKWQAAVKVRAADYVMEIAIPYNAIAVEPPGPGDKWGLNICRQRPGTDPSNPEMSAWSIPYANFHVPSHFGTIIFK